MFKRLILQFIRPSRSEIYNIHDPFGLKLLTRLRVEFSHLREHKFRHNFQDTLNPLCSCSLEPESVNHFLLHCPFYTNQRKILLDGVFGVDERVSNISEINLVQLLLYGNPHMYSIDINSSIINFTITYLKMSGRFDNPLF